jgi:hypothetical protein
VQLRAARARGAGGGGGGGGEGGLKKRRWLGVVTTSRPSPPMSNGSASDAALSSLGASEEPLSSLSLPAGLASA